MSFTTYKWTIEKWHQIVDLGVLDHEKVELIEGEIIEFPREEIPYYYTRSSISNYLKDFLKGKASISESHPITLLNSEPEPDIAICTLPDIIYRQHHPYAENIYFVIEISNKNLQFDLTIKARIYAKNNIPEYWVVDLINNKVIVHTLPKDNSYQKIEEYDSGKITITSLPDIDIELSNILLYR